MEALEDIPEIEQPLLTEKGPAKLQKTDIFRKIMWFGYDDENSWHPLQIDRVNRIIKLNKEGKKPATLLEDTLIDTKEAALNSDLEAMDKKYATHGKKKKKKKKKKKRGNKPNDQQ